MASSRKAPKKAEKAAAKKSSAKAPSKPKAAPKPAPKKAEPAPAKKAAASKAEPIAPAPAKAVPAPAAAPAAPLPPSAPALEPEFVKRATFAERKAALEAVLDSVGVPRPAAPAAEAPAALPPFVREVSPVERKAAVERIVEESGVAGALSKAPWKRSTPAPAPTPPPAAEPPQRTSPKIAMTKAPLVPEAGKSPPRVVILDTNALMMQFQFHVDIEREVRRILNFNYEIVIPEIVVHELERLAKDGNGKEQGEARMAAELARTFKVVPSPGDGDTGLLRLAEKLNAVVVTNDKVLRARLRAKDIPNIYMRSRAFLTIEGHIPGM